VQHQRCLARGRRARERRRGDADDNPPSAKGVQHVAGGEGAVDGENSWPASASPGVADGSRSAPRATTITSASNAPASVSTRRRTGSMDRIAVWTNRTPGFTRSRVGMPDRLRRGAAEHHVELGEAEHESVGLVDQHDVGVTAELVREPGGQLQAAEAGAEHENAHLSALEKLPGDHHALDLVGALVDPGVVECNRWRTARIFEIFGFTCRLADGRRWASFVGFSLLPEQERNTGLGPGGLVPLVTSSV